MELFQTLKRSCTPFVQIESDYSYKKETKNILIKPVKPEKQDKQSAFDRLDKSDSTQVS